MAYMPSCSPPRVQSILALSQTLMYLVFPTEQFREKVVEFGLQERVARIQEDVESAREPTVLRRYFWSFRPYLVGREGRLRLIASVRSWNGESILFLLDVLEYDSRQFAAVRRSAREQEWPLPSDQEIHRWLSDRKQEERPKPAPLPEDLRPWLERPGRNFELSGEDVVVYESESWVRAFRRNEIWRYWQDYYELLFNLAVGDARVRDSDVAQAQLAGRDEVWILFRRFEAGAVDAPRNVLFLVAPFHGAAPSAAAQEDAARAVLPVLDIEHEASLDDVARYAERAYPDYLLGHKDAWIAIQEGEEANLALSPEEETVLADLSSPEPTSTLPVFLNGRAGSGKSTLLYYLFADYCGRKFERDLVDSPLFLTYNESLVDIGRASVRNILLYHHHFLARRGERLDERSLPPIDDFFRPFRRFLLELLSDGERERYRPENYVSFHRFRQIYLGEPLKRPSQDEVGPSEEGTKDREISLNPGRKLKWSPELCWYVLRTFIKGYLLEGRMTPEDYRDVPRRERVISDDTFQAIYDHVWPWYRDVCEKGYWDDQDLIRRVLETRADRGFEDAKYSAVFCDEAQDFTRLELRLIMQLSVLTRYDLGSVGPVNLPFAFAGDPFQTLNPTGFRWSGCQATFYEEVIESIDPLGQYPLKMGFRELLFNYRSTPSIVRTTNLIQLWRHVLLGHVELEPQAWWGRGESPEPEKFVFGINLTPEDMGLHVTNTIILIPCEEGQEDSYVRNDRELARALVESGNGEAPKNVLSAIAAKGLEFKRVILYKFGEACPEATWEGATEPEEHALEVEYFFNKLYVAATRAREALFVVDSVAGSDRLWQQAAPDAIESFVERSKHPDRWRELVSGIAEGSNPSVMSETDPLAIAQEFRDKGMALEEPEHLRRASRFYGSVGKTDEADRCEAWALRYDRDFAAAGRFFERLNIRDEAWSSYWDGLCWRELDRWYEHPRAPKSGDYEVAYRIARFLLSEPNSAAPVEEFSRFLEDRIHQDGVGGPLRRQWKVAVREFQDRAANLQDGAIDQDGWLNLALILDELEEIGHRGSRPVAGSCYFRAGQHGDAAARWEASAATDHLQYFIAKAGAEGFPESLRWLARMPEQYGRDDRVIAEWTGAEDVRQARHALWTEVVAPALERKAHLESSAAAARGQRSTAGHGAEEHSQRVVDSTERRKRALELYREAFDLYLGGDGQANAENADRCLTGAVTIARGDAHIEVWDWVEPLVRKHIDLQDWVEILRLLDRHRPIAGREAEELRLRCDVVRGLAYVRGMIYTDRIPPAAVLEGLPDDRDQFAELAQRLQRAAASTLRETVEPLREIDLFRAFIAALRTQGWERHLTPVELGAAYERGGQFRDTLPYYERFTNVSDRALRDHARRRWIVTKAKQAFTFEQQSDRAEQARQARRELEAQIGRWS